MTSKITQDKHMIRTVFDRAFLRDLEEAGEIKIAADGRVYGMEAYVKRLSRRRR